MAVFNRITDGASVRDSLCGRSMRRSARCFRAGPSPDSGSGAAECGGAALVVQSVQPGSPAAAAGLRKGDEVVRMNGRNLDSLLAFNEEIGRAGDRRTFPSRSGAVRRTAPSLRLLDEKSSSIMICFANDWGFPSARPGAEDWS